jgi:O-antigen ligase
MRLIWKQNSLGCDIFVAKNHPISRSKKYLHILLVACTPLLAFIAYSGTSSAYWVLEPYDGWRILQVIILLLLSIYGISTQTNETSLPANATRYLNLSVPLLIGLVLISVWTSEHSARAATDAALYALLAMSIWAQARIFRKHPAFAPNIAAWLAVLPVLTVIHLPIALISYAFGSGKQEWHELFPNIRMLDDALLPCLFLLWQRPAWLASHPFKNNTLNNLHRTAIFALSTLYILALWYDGARAGLLSTLIGLGFIVVFRRDLWGNLRLPFFSLISASLLYFVLQHVPLNFLANPILRTGSSGRDGLWAKCLTLWRQHPLFGVGGDNFVTSNPWLLNGHPHNLPLQLVSEYGFAGLLILLLLVPIATKIFKHRKILPAFAIAAVIAVMFDALCSGVMVYPLSQTLGLWSLAWLIALLPTHTVNAAQPVHQVNSDTVVQIHTSSVWHVMFKIIALLAIVAMLVIHGKDMICIKCTSIDDYNAPRFWQYGRALHLEPQVRVELQVSP